jgi:tetratricopeptide (TPR) repeat protein
MVGTIREEVFMRTHRVLTVVLTILLGLAPLAALAADELFDTKEAGQHIEKGIGLLKAKNFDAAIGEFEESAELNPDAEVYYYLGYAYYLKGRSGDEESRTLSRENFEKAYEIDPNFSPTRYKPAQPPAFEPQQKSEVSQNPAAPPAAPASQAAEPAAPAPEQPAPPAEQPKQ